MTENEYRALDRISYSAIKDYFTLGGLYFYKKYILKEEVKKKDSPSLTRGRAVDSFIFDDEETFNSKFHIVDTPTITGKGLDFVNKLFELTQDNPEAPFMVLAEQAYNLADLKTPKFENYMVKFEGSKAEALYQNLLQSNGKTILTVDDMVAVERVVNGLRNSSNTAWIFQQEGFSQLPIFFTVNGTKLKGLLDRVVIDHKKKVIYPFDLKCIDNVNDFGFKWLKDYYFLQEGLYSVGLELWRDENYPDYKIEKFKFIVCSQEGYQAPLIWDMKLGEGDIYEGGKTIGGRNVDSIYHHLFVVNWATENNVWDMKYEYWLTKGIVEKTL